MSTLGPPTTPGVVSPPTARRRYLLGWVVAAVLLLLVLAGILIAGVLLMRSAPGLWTPVATDIIKWPPAGSFMLRWNPQKEGSVRWVGAMNFTNPWSPGSGASRRPLNSEGISIPVPQDNEMVIAVHVPRGVAPAQATGMELQVCSLVRTVMGDVLPTRGVPYVECFLDARQAAYVAQNDVPPELIIAMRDAAKKASWKAMPLGVNTMPEVIEIDPAPFFPPTAGTAPPVQPPAPC